MYITTENKKPSAAEVDLARKVQYIHAGLYFGCSLRKNLLFFRQKIVSKVFSP